MHYSKKADEVMAEFGTSKDGLTQEQVQVNKEKYGENKLEEKKKKSTFRVFLEQFKDLLVIILIIAAIISAVAGNLDSMIVIIVVLIMNAILGTVQYIKAEKSLESLKKLSAPIAKVIRDGKNLEIPASEVVCGDVIRLEAGDVVPCDGRLIDCHSLKSNESSLTGESEPCEKCSEVITTEDGKEVALGDQVNMVFSGALVTYGRGCAVATAVGTSTELGKIASLMENTKERRTPLQITMDNFSKKLSIVIMALCALVFAIYALRGMGIIDSLLFAVALAVAAIPEALSSIITISLAIGTKKMAEQNAIIKDLKAVEGLGCISIICSDKTGTLTQNKMTVVDTYCPYSDLDTLMQTSILANDTVISEEGTLGDPTETSLVEYYLKNKDDYDSFIQSHPRKGEIPFDSDRKLMSTLHDIDGKTIMMTKGAPDVLLSRISNLSDAQIIEISEQIIEYSKDGLRVLAFARKEISTGKELVLDDENDMDFIGLIAMVDPPREESAQAVAKCKQAGIIPIMITGDYKETAAAIASSIGIIGAGHKVVSGPELDAMSEEQLMAELENIRVYARVSPENKIRIVNAWQEKDQIVAMTGDGVNDAPAIKSADVGIAMGITGTEVSKDAASMILADDNFATIVQAVLNGRNVYANIKNAIMFLLSGNAAGIFVVLYAALVSLPAPFTAIHLLFINLLTDSLPALALSMEPSNPYLLKAKPRDRKENILNKPTLGIIGYQGLIIGVATMAAFYIGYETSAEVAMTMAFATVCLARLWHGFNSRGRETIFQLGIFTNLYTIGALILGAGLLALVLFVPGLQGIFQVAELTGTQIGWIAILAFAPTVAIQIIKAIVRKH